MKYLFLDIECSNGNDICSIGYVLTDDNLNLLEQKDILINPESRFVLTNKSGTQGISLAYEQEEFYAAPIFPHYYESIKNLLENENNIVIGFAVSNDAGFIKRACERYGLEQINFNFFDIQRLDAALHCNGQIRSLQKVLDSYNIEQDDENILHKSDDDAYFTLEVLIKILQETNLDCAQIISNNPWCCGESKNGCILYDGKSVSNVDKMRKKDVIVFRKYCTDLKERFSLNKGVLSGKRVCFDRSFESKQYRKMLVLAPKIYSSGGIISSFPTCNMYVYSGKENCQTEKLRAKNIPVILLDDFLNLVGLTPEELDREAKTLDIVSFKNQADRLN